MQRQVEALRREVEAGLDRSDLQTLLPPGGARNALDCALWDLEAKVCKTPVWELAGLAPPRPLMTTFTCGAESSQEMAATARSYSSAQAIKVKLTGESTDAERVIAVRAARPDVWLGVDGNQGFTPKTLERLLPVLLEAQVRMVEQPFPVGQEVWLDGFECAVR